MARPITRDIAKPLGNVMLTPSRNILLLRLGYDCCPLKPENLLRHIPCYEQFHRSTESDLIYLKDNLSFPKKPNQTVILNIQASSSVGKNELINLLMQRVPGITRFASATTREPNKAGRKENSADHIFLSKDKMIYMIIHDQLIEHAIIGAANDIYGMPKGQIDLVMKDKPRLVLMEIDTIGYLKVKQYIQEHYPHSQIINSFMVPTLTFPEYIARLFGKRGYAEGSNRLLKAMDELIAAPKIADILLLNPFDPTGKPQRVAEDVMKFISIIEK